LDTPSPVKEPKAPVTPNRGRIGSDLSTSNIRAKNDSLKEVWILAHDQELKGSFDGYYSAENGIFENTLVNVASMESGAIKGLTPSTEGENIGWYLADIDPTGTYNPNSDKQPVIDVLLSTRCSADAKFIAFIDAEDPCGKQEWTLVKQLYNSNGLMPGGGATASSGSGADTKPYSPTGEYDYLDYVESKIIKLEVFTDGGSYEAAKALAKSQGFDTTVTSVAPTSSGSKKNKAGASPEKLKNQYDALELRANDEKFSMYDGKFELGAKPDLGWLL